MYYVYAIYNARYDKIYIGQTCDWVKRLREHNDPSDTTHKYTRRFGTGWELIYKEDCVSRKEALRREKQLKSYQGRLFIKSFIPR